MGGEKQPSDPTPAPGGGDRLPRGSEHRWGRAGEVRLALPPPPPHKPTAARSAGSRRRRSGCHAKTRDGASWNSRTLHPQGWFPGWPSSVGPCPRRSPSGAQPSRHCQPVRIQDLRRPRRLRGSGLKASGLGPARAARPHVACQRLDWLMRPVGGVCGRGIPGTWLGALRLPRADPRGAECREGGERRARAVRRSPAPPGDPDPPITPNS